MEDSFKVMTGLSGGAFVGVDRTGEFLWKTAEFHAPNFDGCDVKSVLHLLLPQNDLAQPVRLHQKLQTFHSQLRRIERTGLNRTNWDDFAIYFTSLS